MPNYTDILVRDSLQDVGVIPSPGYPYTSPDIICTQQNTYSNPGAQFGTTTSYNGDPNLSVINGQNNNFYVRGKNLGTANVGGNMYVYWSKASLLLTPNLWFNQPMTTLNSQSQNYVALPSVGANQISVGATPFNWTPPSISPNDHFCLIGAVSTGSHPWPPTSAPTFANSDEFTMWVRNNQNICWRNLYLVTNPNQPQWDRLDSFSNPWTTTMPMMVQAACTNVPVGTTIKLICTALGINTSVVTTTTNQTVYSNGTGCPAGFNGFIETTANLPSGTTSWPSGAMITTTVFVGTSTTSPAFVLAHDFGDDEEHPHVKETRRLVQKTLNDSNGGALIAIGNTATAYQPTV